MIELNYSIWAMKQTPSAKNKVMIGIPPRSSRELGVCKWKLFEFTAIDDYHAEKEIIRLINEWTPADHRTIAGLSYLRQCRPRLR